MNNKKDLDLEQIIEAECTFCGKYVRVPLKCTIEHLDYHNTVDDCESCEDLREEYLNTGKEHLIQLARERRYI